MSPRFRISTLPMLSWLPKSSVSVAEHPGEHPDTYDCLLFFLSPDHVSEYFKLLVRVRAKAIMCLDPVLVDNSQTSEGFQTIREVLSATQPGSVHLHQLRTVHWYARRHGKRIQCLKPVGWLSPSAFAVLAQLDFGHVGCLIKELKS